MSYALEQVPANKIPLWKENPTQLLSFINLLPNREMVKSHSFSCNVILLAIKDEVLKLHLSGIRCG